MHGRNRLFAALAAYLVLGALAWSSLDGAWRAGVLLWLGALALLSWVHGRRQDRN